MSPCQETTATQYDFNITYFTRQTAWVGKRFFSFLDKSPQEAKIRLHHLFLSYMSYFY